MLNKKDKTETLKRIKESIEQLRDGLKVWTIQEQGSSTGVMFLGTMNQAERQCHLLKQWQGGFWYLREWEEAIPCPVCHSATPKSTIDHFGQCLACDHMDSDEVPLRGFETV
jgi:hypothetical protein